MGKRQTMSSTKLCIIVLLLISDQFVTSFVPSHLQVVRVKSDSDTYTTRQPLTQTLFAPFQGLSSLSHLSDLKNGEREFTLTVPLISELARKTEKQTGKSES
jgi:hypothetical protein